MTVPINTVLSAIFLYSMFGYVVIVCYLAMAGLLLMQYLTNKKIAKLEYTSLKLADKRIQLLA
jgi:hypothetical protein